MDRAENIRCTLAWSNFQEAAREALAAGNEFSFLLHILKEQNELIQEAHDTLYVRGS